MMPGECQPKRYCCIAQERIAVGWMRKIPAFQQKRRRGSTWRKIGTIWPVPSRGSRVRRGSSEIGGLAFIESHVAPLEERPDIGVLRPQTLVLPAGSQFRDVHRKYPAWHSRSAGRAADRVRPQLSRHLGKSLSALGYWHPTLSAVAIDVNIGIEPSRVV